MLLCLKASFYEFPDDFALDWINLRGDELCIDQVTSSSEVDPTKNLHQFLCLILGLKCRSKPTSSMIKFVLDLSGLNFSEPTQDCIHTVISDQFFDDSLNHFVMYE